MQDCFENIIGITQTECECFTDDFSADARKTNSGLFMDQLEESPSLDAFKTNRECGTTLEAVLTQARSNAIADFKRALYMDIGTRYTVRQQPYDGTIGQPSANGLLTLAYAVAGVALEMQRTRGATIEVTSIKPLFNYDGTLEVTIYRAVASGNTYTILATERVITLNTLINDPVAQAPAQPLILAATDESGIALTYIFAYNTQAEQKPKNNTTSCGCGGKEAVMHSYVSPYGIVGTDINAISLNNRTSYINGLLISVEARCGTGDFICMNYNKDEFIREAINWAILYRSVSNSITGLLNSNLVTRYSMANREQMSYNVNVLGGKFRKSIAWLAEHIDLRQNDCYVCTPGITGTNFDYQREGILL